LTVVTTEAENAFGVLRGPGGTSIKSHIHYHILWSDSKLDWKPFATKEEAEDLAATIKKPGESYGIVERGQDCERCKDAGFKFNT